MIKSVFKFLPAGFSGVVTAVHVSENAVRRIEMQKKKNRAAVLKCMSFQRGEDKDLKQDLDRVFCDDPVRGRLVVITDEVRFLATEFSLTDTGRLSEEKQLAAAIWEIEPYLDFSSSEGLFACKIQSPDRSRDNSRMPALVCAMEKSRYAAYEDIFKNHGPAPANIYSAETAMAASLVPGTDKDRVFLLGCYGHRAMGVCITPSGPVVFQEKVLVNEQDVSPDLSQLTGELSDIAGQAREIVLAGRIIPEQVDDFAAWHPGQVRPWHPDDLGAVLDNRHETFIGPEYAPALGAGLHELGLLNLALPALTSRVPLKDRLLKKIKENPKLVPGITMAGLILMLAGHYLYTLSSINRYERQFAGLKAEKQRLAAPLQEEERLKALLARTIDRKTYIKDTLLQSNLRILRMLNAVSTLIPRDVVIDSIRQEQDQSFTIKGSASSGESITDFNDSLSLLEYCEATVLESVSRADRASGTRGKIFPYSFSITVTDSPVTDRPARDGTDTGGTGSGSGLAQNKQ